MPLTRATSYCAAIVWAYARLGFHPGPLLGCLAENLTPDVRALPPTAVSRTAWAFATLDHGDRCLIAAVVAAAAPRLHMYSTQVDTCLHARDGGQDAQTVQCVRAPVRGLPAHLCGDDSSGACMPGGRRWWTWPGRVQCSSAGMCLCLAASPTWVRAAELHADLLPLANMSGIVTLPCLIRFMMIRRRLSD